VNLLLHSVVADCHAALVTSAHQSSVTSASMFCLLYCVVLALCQHVARQISSELFYQTLHTVGTHAGIFIGMIKSIRDDCSRVILLYEDLSQSMLAKWHHFLIVDYG
jgi:hypothetical protein